MVWGALLSTAAVAQSPHAQATARALFHEGLEHADAADWDQAADRFARAHALRPAPAIALNLGIAREHLGQLVAASEALRSVVRDDATPASLRERAVQRLDAILPRLGALVVELDGSREGLSLFVDDRQISLAIVGVESAVDPGVHRVRATREGEVVAEGEIAIAEGATETVRLSVPEPVEADAPVDLRVRETDAVEARQLDAQVETQPASSRAWYRRGWVWTLVAVGVGAIVGGGIAASRRGRGSQSACDELSLGCVEP